MRRRLTICNRAAPQVSLRNNVSPRPTPTSRLTQHESWCVRGNVSHFVLGFRSCSVASRRLVPVLFKRHSMMDERVASYRASLTLVLAAADGVLVFAWFDDRCGA
jgi:hypothetical protein